MSARDRSFGALIGHDAVTLVEYQAERGGIRVVGTWTDTTPSGSVHEALSRLSSLITSQGVRRARLALAIEQFGVFHHVMTLPPAADDVLRPVVMREVQRVFGIPDPVVVFTRGTAQERRDPTRADERTAPRQLFVAGAPRETIGALRSELASKGIQLEIATVVPKAMHSLYEAAGAGLEATAVLVCLESGPHLAFFLDGRLELAIDPPIALEGDRPTVSMILDQVERGAVYFRQQFRGATATRVLLAARADEYRELAAALEDRLSARVAPLFAGQASPEAVIAMGAVLEARHAKPLDLYPHPPTAADRMAVMLRGPNGAVAAAAGVALIAAVWAAAQVASVSRAQNETEALRKSLREALPAVAPMRAIAERREATVKQVGFVRDAVNERATIARTLAAIGSTLPAGAVLDTLSLARAPNGWSSHVAGTVSGASAAQAVHGLEALMESIRTRPTVSAVTLDGFDYANVAQDSTKRDVGVTLRFQVSLTINRLEPPH